jgi:hypothetical protein
MASRSGAPRRGDRKQDFLAMCRGFLAELDELALSAAEERLGPLWWNEVSSVLRAALGQDALISRGFEGARSAFLRSGKKAELKRKALAELKKTLEEAATRIESLPSTVPLSWQPGRKTA